MSIDEENKKQNTCCNHHLRPDNWNDDYTDGWKHFYELQRSFSHNHLISRDHDKFIAIWKSGGALVSAIPPFSTHCEPAYLSPTIPWENFA